ncbi:MAG: hypothetical protein ACREFM_25910, partial [Hypericibacter sp.]
MLAIRMARLFSIDPLAAAAPVQIEWVRLDDIMPGDTAPPPPHVVTIDPPEPGQSIGIDVDVDTAIQFAFDLGAAHVEWVDHSIRLDLPNSGVITLFGERIEPSLADGLGDIEAILGSLSSP